MRPINVFTPPVHLALTCKLRPLVGKNYSTKIVVRCFAFGCANRFGALQGHSLKGFPTFLGYKKAMDHASESPRLDLIKILERICGDYFVSGKRIVQKLELTLDLSRARLIL